MKIRIVSFKTKILFSYVFVLCISFLFASYLLNKYLEENSLQEIKSSLTSQATLLANQIPPQKLDANDASYLDSIAKSLGKGIQGRITIIDASGSVLADSQQSPQEVIGMDNHASLPEVKSALNADIGEEIRFSSTLKIDMLYIAVPVRARDGAIAGVVRLALPLIVIQRQFASIRKAMFFSLFLALGLAFVLGSLLSKDIVRPLHRIIHSTRKFSEGDFGHTIVLDSKDEVGQLAQALNKMAREIEDKIKQIEVQNQHLHAILQSMVEGIIVVDKGMRILSLNPPAERIFSITAEAVRQKLFIEAVPNNDIADIIHDVLKNGQVVSKELSLVWPVQGIFGIDASPFFEKGSIQGCLLVIHDITTIRKLETMRTDFVANVSHELRTPLTSIKGFVETLLEGALDDKEHAREFLAIIQDHANRLNNLVDDLLSLSCLESKERLLVKTKINLSELVNGTFVGFKSLIRKKAIEAKNDIGSDVYVQADKDKLGQVVTNLIDNAIKFNRENGTVRIYSEAGENSVKVVVEDTGLGIPAKDIPRIFERFYRVDKARSREMGGTGLGLSIVKHIIELHGGSVGVESTEGLGSKFWFILPIS